MENEKMITELPTVEESKSDVDDRLSDDEIMLAEMSTEEPSPLWLTIIDQFLEEAEDNFLQVLLECANESEDKYLEVLVESFLELFEMFSESYDIDAESVSTFVSWIDSYKDDVLCPLQRGLTRLVHEKSVCTIKFEDDNSTVDWLDVISKSEQFFQTQKLSTTESKQSKELFTYLLVRILEEEASWFTSHPHVINGLVILLANSLKPEQLCLTGLIELFLEKGLKTSFLQFISGEMTEFPEQDKNLPEASLGEEVILHLCGVIILDLTKMDISSGQVKYLAELCGAFSSVPVLDAKKLSEFLSFLAEKDSAKYFSWQIFVGRLDATAVSYALFRVLLEKPNVIPCSKKTAILEKLTNAEDKKYSKYVVENFHQFAGKCVCLKSQVVIQSWAKSLPPKLSKLFSQNFRNGFIYSPFLLQNFNQFGHVGELSIFFANKLKKNEEMEKMLDFEALSMGSNCLELFSWVLCNLSQNAQKRATNFLIERYLNSTKFLEPELLFLLPILLERPDFDNADFFVRLIRTLSVEKVLPRISPEFLLFFNRYLNSFENSSFQIKWKVLKPLAQRFFPTETMEMENDQKILSSDQKPNLQTEAIILLNSVLMKLQFPEKSVDYFSTVSSNISNFEKMSPIQVILICHAAFQFPKSILTSEFVEKICKMYSGSLSITDQLIKRVLQTFEMLETPINLNYNFTLSSTKLLETVNCWADVCLFMKDPSKCQMYMDFSVPFRRKMQDDYEGVYDPEFVLGILGKQISEILMNKIYGYKPVIKFIGDGCLSFLLMAASEFSPVPIVRIAKCLLMQVLKMLQKFSQKFDIIISSLNTLRNGLENEDDTMSHMLAHFFAQIFTSMIDANTEEPSLKKRRRFSKTVRFSKAPTIYCKNITIATNVSLLLENLTRANSDFKNFPSRTLVKFISIAQRDDSVEVNANFLLTKICESILSEKNLDTFVKSGMLAITECIVTTNVGDLTHKWMVVKTLCKSVSKFRDVFKIAVLYHKLDLLLFNIIDAKYPIQIEGSSELTVKQTVMALIETSVFDDTGKFEPLKKILTPQKSLLYLERYVSALLVKQKECADVLERQVAVVIVLLLRSDDFLYHRLEFSNFMAKFLEISCHDLMLNRSKIELRRTMVTFLRWTVSCCIDAYENGIDGRKRKLLFADKMLSVLNKVCFP